MRKNSCWIFLVAILLLGVSAVSTVKAESKPVIRIQPPNSAAEPGQTFTFNVTVTGVTQDESLFGWNVWITFNPQIINCVSATEGPFLSTSGYEVMWLTPSKNNTKGQVVVGALLSPTEAGFPPHGATGDGVLASITFQAVGRGTTSLHFDFTELYTIIGTEIQIEHTKEDGSFSNGGGLPLELIVAVVVVVAVIGVGGVLLYRRRRGA